MANSGFTRRQIFGAATAAAAAQAGASILGSSKLAQGHLGNGLMNAIRRGEGTAFADTAALSAQTAPVAVIISSAKLDAGSTLFRSDAAAAGAVGNADYAPSSAFASFGLAKWFGDMLAPIESKVSMAAFVTAKADNAAQGGGNHDFAGVITDMTKTGCLTYNLNKQLASLMSLDFGVNATVDTATAVFSEGGTQLISYSAIADAVSSITGSAAPLQALPTNAAALQTQLNQLISKDPKFSAQLAQLGQVLQGIVTPLKAVATAASAKATVNLQVNDYLNATKVAAVNPLLFQLQTAQILWNAGLTKAVTFAIGNTDTNTNGDIVNKIGGGNTSAVQLFDANGANPQGGLSVAMAKTMMAQFITQFYGLYPNGWVVCLGEGGRDNNQGDADTGMGFLFGPAGAFKNTFVGGDFYAQAANFGKPTMVPLSNGSNGYPSHAYLYATLAKLAGLPAFGTFPDLSNLLKA